MFKIELSPESQLRLDQERAEVARLYSLTDTWLASAILVIARKGQASTPEHRPDDCPTYNSRLIWGIVPEIARRLGVIKMTTNEIDWEIRELSDYALRVRTGYTLANIGYSTLPGWDQLGRDVIHGNAIAFAVDRICPGRIGDRDDPITKRLEEIAACRGSVFTGVWTPEIANKIEATTLD